MKDETLALHAGYTPGNTEPRVLPIVQSTTSAQEHGAEGYAHSAKHDLRLRLRRGDG